MKSWNRRRRVDRRNMLKDQKIFNRFANSSPSREPIKLYKRFPEFLSGFNILERAWAGWNTSLARPLFLTIMNVERSVALMLCSVPIACLLYYHTDFISRLSVPIELIFFWNIIHNRELFVAFILGTILAISVRRTFQSKFYLEDLNLLPLKRRMLFDGGLVFFSFILIWAYILMWLSTSLLDWSISGFDLLAIKKSFMLSDKLYDVTHANNWIKIFVVEITWRFSSFLSLISWLLLVIISLVSRRIPIPSIIGFGMIIFVLRIVDRIILAIMLVLCSGMGFFGFCMIIPVRILFFTTICSMIIYRAEFWFVLQKMEVEYQEQNEVEIIESAELDAILTSKYEHRKERMKTLEAGLRRQRQHYNAKQKKQK